MSLASPIVSGDSTGEPKRKRFGTYSFVLAIVAFVLLTVGFWVATHEPTTASEAVPGALMSFFMLSARVVAPLLTVLGIVLGIASLFRSGDRKVLGAVGAALNAFLLAGVVTLGAIMIGTMGGLR